MRSPRTIGELVEQYDRYITGCIFKVSRGHVRPDDIDDLRQQILLRVHEKNYLKKYDPKKGSFNSYLYWLIRSVFVNQFESNTRNPLNMAVGVVEHTTVEPEPGALVLESLDDAVDDSFERRMMARKIADQFEAHLANVARPWGPPIVVSGQRERRSLALVFRLLRQSLEVQDVAKTLHVSPQSVFGYLKRIRVEAARFQEAVSATAV